MLQNRKIFFKYKSILKFLSFNKMAINKSVWLLRNMLRYIFFFLFKKSFFLHIIFYYKLLLYFFTLKKYLLFKKLSLLSINNNIYKSFLVINKFFNFFFYSHKNSRISINILNVFFFFEKKIIFYNTLNKINFFFLYFKKYIFFLFIWLCSVKFFYFFSFNFSHLPTKKHTFVVLRSPHKDKKSREKFTIRKIRKALLIPSFIYDNYFFSTFSNDSFLIKLDVSVKKK